MEPRDMFYWNNGHTVEGGRGVVTFHADLFVVVTWRTALPHSACIWREGEVSVEK